MKHTIKHLLLAFPLLLAFGCTEELISPDDPENVKTQSLKTKASDLEEDYHYWYQGETLPLTLNPEFLNLLLADPDISDAELMGLTREMHLVADRDSRDKGFVKVRFVEKPAGLDEYNISVATIRKDPRIHGVYPYFERGGGADPIGTSNIFYLKLKGEGDYDPEPMQQMAEKYDVKIVKEVPYMPDWYILSVEESNFENSIDATNCFYESGEFADVDPAFMFDFRPCTVNDPYYSMQWGLNNTTYPDYDINVEGAWNYATGNNIKIAIVEQGGIDYTHNDLSSNIYPLCYNSGSSAIPNMTGGDHGTHVSGIVAAVTNNNLQIAGVAFSSKIIGVKPNLNNSGASAGFASAITWAWQNGADIINNSWGDQGGYYYNELYTSLLNDAIVNAMTYGRNGRGSVVVFAAGNYGENGAVMDYPATADDRILAVGAIGSMGMRASFSGYGSKLDVVAPGVNILSTLPGNTVGMMSGTSMAAPHVSGLAALILSANPNLTREEVARLIELTAKKISPGGSYAYYQTQNRYNGTWNQEVGYGLVDAAAAVSYAWYSHLTPPSGSPSIDGYVPMGAINYGDGTIVINSYPNVTAFFGLPNSLTNSAYTYYWHFTTSGDPYWAPTFNYVGNNNGVEMNLPRPSVNSVLSLSCEVFNGSTHVCTAHRSFDIWRDLP